jgi:hypothetical protein
MTEGKRNFEIALLGVWMLWWAVLDTPYIMRGIVFPALMEGPEVRDRNEEQGFFSSHDQGM